MISTHEQMQQHMSEIQDAFSAQLEEYLAPYFHSLLDKHRAFLLGCYQYYLKDCSYPLVIITYQ